MLLKKLHHVAYRCTDAQATVDFYTRVLGLRFMHAIVQDFVPSIQKFYPHTHIFFEMEDGSCIAFFELLDEKPAQSDPNTPSWVQHLALEVADMPTLVAAKQRLVDAGVEVLGPVDHHFCHSIYFFDPSGHRLEMAAPCEPAGFREKAAADAWAVLEAWNAKKRAKAAAAREPATA
jgi:catechol 2,3-dioxygenase-like lactoylglutathione lyase family enzyme